jgi:FMN-dependent NADH-azoreductase
MTILQIDSSITGDASASRELTAAIVKRLQADDPAARVVTRDVAADPIPHLTFANIADGTAAKILAEFKAADTVVIGAPMYNFTIPSQLKAWIDRILVAGETFRYTATGPEGLAGDKQVIVALTRGGLYGEGSAQRSIEHAERYLTSAFAFIGITPRFVIAEGLKIGDAERDAAIAAAHGEIAAFPALGLAA